jgi:hypothetical protein
MVPLPPEPVSRVPPSRRAGKPVNLPHPSLGTLFKGREDLLADIRAGFEAEGVTEPKARVLNELGPLLKTKARHAEAEPLYRRALVIDERSFGPLRVDLDCGLQGGHP